MADVRRGLGVLCLLGLAVLLGAGPSPEAGAPRLCLDVLDVGQGDALLLHLPGGERWLIDGGGDPAGRVDVGRRRLLPALRRQGIERLDRVFATHGDLDHVGGLEPVLDELQVGELWVPRVLGAGRGLRRLISAAERRGVPVRSVVRGPIPDAPAPVELRVLHPRPDWDRVLGLDADENNGSLVLHVALGRVGFLLTGDVEAPAEQLLLAGGVPRTAVLKVAHHGSKSSTTAPWVAAVDPLVAVTGAGRDNRFGFPHASVSARLLRRHTPLYWTGRHGAVRVCTEGWSITVEHDLDRGGWSPLRTWTAEAVQAWAGTEPVRLEPWEGLGRPRPCPERRGRGSRRRGARRAKEPTPTPEPTPAVLLDDRTWERRRRTRRKPKPPWRR